MTNLLAMTNLIAAMTNAYFGGADMMTNGISVAAESIVEIRLAEGGTMTRPIETVSVVTNVTQWNNEQRSPHRFSWSMGEPTPGSVTKEMTEKTETTEIIEIKTLRFSWNGQDYALEQRKVLSTKTRKWVRKDNWEETP